MDDITNALIARDWYSLVVLLVVLLTGFATKTKLWLALPVKFQPAVPVFLGCVAGLADAYAEGLPWRAAIFRTIGAGLQIGLGAIGIHHTKKRLVPTNSSKNQVELPGDEDGLSTSHGTVDDGSDSNLGGRG